MDGAFFLVTHSEFSGAMGKGRKPLTWATTAMKRCIPTTFQHPRRSRPRQRQCGRRHSDLAERDKDRTTDHKRTTQH